MNRVDEILIRDADLVEQLESYDRGQTFGRPGYRTAFVQQLIETQRQRDAKMLERDTMPRAKRARAVIREVFENKPPSPNDVRHIHSVLAVCGMPYDRLPMDQREFERRQGNMALDITAGFLRDPNGNKTIQPLPFGPKARLLMMHLCSEAVRQKSPTIEIADSLSAFIRDMGFPVTGGAKGTLTAFKQQINALAACTMKISVWDGQVARTKTVTPFDSIDVWLPTDLDQRMLWPSTVTFSENMFQSLGKHALPVNTHAVKAFAGSARKLDLYFWLGYRLYNIAVPTRISWAALGEQFGQGFGRARAFRAQFAEEIAHIKEVFPKLPIKVTEEGVALEPADPSVLALPTPRRRKR